MGCEKCGASIGENENFCGQCGAQILNTNDRYQVYNYNERQAKDNRIYMTYGDMIKKALWSSLFLVVGAILIGALMEDGPAMLIVGGLLCVIMITIIVVVAIRMAIYVNAPLLAIVHDKQESVHYIVQCPVNYYGGWDTASRAAGAIAQGIERERLSKKAQVDALMVCAVEQYKADEISSRELGISVVESGQIVTKLKSPQVVKSNKKEIVISYEQENKRRKKIKIANAYPGFSI